MLIPKITLEVYMKREAIYVKEQDTIHILCQYLDDTGLGIDLSTVIIHSGVSSLSGGIKHTFDVEITDSLTGQFALLLTGGNLYVGTYLVDILFESTVSGRTVASDTFDLMVTKAITKRGI